MLLRRDLLKAVLSLPFLSLRSRSKSGFVGRAQCMPHPNGYVPITPMTASADEGHIMHYSSVMVTAGKLPIKMGAMVLTRRDPVTSALHVVAVECI